MQATYTGSEDNLMIYSNFYLILLCDLNKYLVHVRKSDSNKIYMVYILYESSFYEMFLSLNETSSTSGKVFSVTDKNVS